MEGAKQIEEMREGVGTHANDKLQVKLRFASRQVLVGFDTGSLDTSEEGHRLASGMR